jgi:hypothetical protein
LNQLSSPPVAAGCATKVRVSAKAERASNQQAAARAHDLNKMWLALVIGVQS